MRQSETLLVSKIKYSLFTGHQVLELINDPKFQNSWDLLYETCQNSTVYQSREFVATWYTIYHEYYLPIIFIAEREDELSGMLALAKDEKGFIVGAGASQAEYQVWLTSDTNHTFIKKALKEIHEEFGNSIIHLKYVTSKASLDWISDDPYFAHRSIVRVHRQPVIEIEETVLDNELRKKNRREKLNRLRRMGNLSFERISDHDVFHSIFEDLASQYDFRKGSMFDRYFFKSDPLRKKFLLALFEKQLLHATVLKLNQEIIASNVGTIGKRQVHLQGINTHAPAYAKYSPGILHFLMLGKLLATERIDVFDLTPGIDAYKEVLATSTNHVFEVYVGTRSFCFKKELKYSITDFIKRGLNKAGINSISLKTLKLNAQLTYYKITHILSQPKELLFLYKPLKGKGSSVSLVDINFKQQNAPSTLPVVGKNNLADLLEYEQSGSWQIRWEFLQQAMHRYEIGEQSYSWAEQGRLLGCVWAVQNGKSGQQAISLPEGAAVLQGLYCHTLGKAQVKAFLAAVAKDIQGEGGTREVFLVTDSRHKNLLKV